MQAAQALSLLQWLGGELGQLPQAQQREALRLPLQLGGKLTSRVAARALRAVLLPPQSPAQAAPSVSSRAEDEPLAPARSAVSRVQSPRSAPRPLAACQPSCPISVSLLLSSMSDARSHSQSLDASSPNPGHVPLC